MLSFLSNCCHALALANASFIFALSVCRLLLLLSVCYLCACENCKFRKIACRKIVCRKGTCRKITIRSRQCIRKLSEGSYISVITVLWLPSTSFSENSPLKPESTETCSTSSFASGPTAYMRISPSPYFTSSKCGFTKLNPICTCTCDVNYAD